jgi:hypothetical protein
MCADRVGEAIGSLDGEPGEDRAAIWRDGSVVENEGRVSAGKSSSAVWGSESVLPSMWKSMLIDSDPVETRRISLDSIPPVAYEHAQYTESLACLSVRAVV